MRRAAFQPLRAVRRTTHPFHHHARRPPHNRAITRPVPRPHGTELLSCQTQSRVTLSRLPDLPPGAIVHNVPPPLQAALVFRNAAVALLTSLIAYGAWFAAASGGRGVLGTAVDKAEAPPNGPRSGPIGVPAGSTPYLSGTVLDGADPKASPSVGNATSAAVSGGAAADDPAADVDPARRAVILENGQIALADLAALTTESEDPTALLSKAGAPTARQVLEMVTPEQASQRLREHEQSFFVDRGKGVARYDLVQLASNNPIEDDHVERTVEVPEELSPKDDGAGSAGRPDWMFWGVFDGHSGWTTSARLQQSLVSYVARELHNTYKSAKEVGSPLLSPNSGTDSAAPDVVANAIKQGFVRLDNDIVNTAVTEATKAKTKGAAVDLLAPAFSGSCALLAFYDTRAKLLRVACTGDSRAVLGTRSPTNAAKWVATPLSEDFTGGTPSEQARLAKEHPGEEFVTHNGRILGGLEPSRAFGDAIYKWSADTAARVKRQFLGRSPPSLAKTPPYVTAEPVVTTTAVDPRRGDFVVLATDGLWECLTNEEVVGLVGKWLDAQPRLTPQAAASPSSNQSAGTLLNSLWGSSTSAGVALPVEKHNASRARTAAGGGGGSNDGGQRLPIRQDQYRIGAGDERFVVEDANAATHLVRNALGGKDRDMVCALLSLPSPYARRYRDDLTVQVIFFGDSPPVEGDEGGLRRNFDATSAKEFAKAKL